MVPLQKRPKTIRVGSRGSDLARMQAETVIRALQAQNPGLHCEWACVTTTGDKDSRSLSQIGGKGVFIKELEETLLKGRIDLAVHSLKDVTSQPHPELIFSGFLKPESIRDVLIFRQAETLHTLSKGATVATGSLRRRYQLLKRRPDLNLIDIRGNVPTRIQKLQDNQWDAVMLSEVGLMRLGISCPYQEPMNPDQFLPAPGQGVVAIEHLNSRTDIQALCEAISDSDQRLISQIELAFLQAVGFDCRMPLGMRTVREGDHIRTHILAATEDFQKEIEIREAFPVRNWKEKIQELATRTRCLSC